MMAYGGEIAAAIAAEEAATVAAAAAAEAAAGTAATGAAAYGGTGAAASALAGGTDTFAAQMAAQQAAEVAAYNGVPYGAGETVTNSLLGSPSLPYGAGDTVTNSLVNPELNQFEKYMQAGKEGFRNLGAAANKIPGPVQGIMLQGLLGQPQQQPQQNISRPSGGGGSAPSGPNVPQQQPLPRVVPFAQSIGSGGYGDEEEMRRRRMMMQRMGQNAY